MPVYDGSLVPRFQEFLEPLLRSSPFFRRKIDGAVLFDVTGLNPEQILVDFRSPPPPAPRDELRHLTRRVATMRPPRRSNPRATRLH
jgi:hypothetical protein